MSTTVSTRTPGTLNPTRQQLDELDALLKRMLELPVNQLDDKDDAEEEDADEEPSAPPPSFHPPQSGGGRGRPAEGKSAAPAISYMVVETASPRPVPLASGFEPRPSVLAPPPPVVPPKEEAIEKEPAMPMPDHLAAPAAPPMPAADSPPSEPEEWVPLRSTWQPSPQTWQPLADSWQQANGATTPAARPAPIPPPHLVLAPPREIPLPPPPAPLPIESAPRPAPVVAVPVVRAGGTPALPGSAGVPPAIETAAAPLRLTAEDAPVAVPAPLLPLVWFNQGFDACLAPLGVVGHWLSSVKGRRTLGVAGLLCLAAATALAVSAGMGWTW